MPDDVLYTYTGPITALEMPADEARGTAAREQMLHDGAQVSLPAADPHVQALVELGRLTIVEPSVDATIAAAKTSAKPAKREP